MRIQVWYIDILSFQIFTLSTMLYAKCLLRKKTDVVVCGSRIILKYCSKNERGCAKSVINICTLTKRVLIF